MKHFIGLLVGVIVLFGCAPVPTDLLPDRPVAGGSCNPDEIRSILINANCGGCVNSRLACTQGGFWACLRPAQGEQCEHIDAGAPITSDAATALDAASATDAAMADVSVVPTDRPSSPSDAGPRIVGGVCTNGLGACISYGVWVQRRPGVLECNAPIVVTSTPELCDLTGVDENCNGYVNEDCQCLGGQTRPCYAGAPNTRDVGICRGGTNVCDAQGRWSASCMGELLPRSADICNNRMDDDCNGLTDETPCPSPR